jgi:hypothetical protein
MFFLVIDLVIFKKKVLFVKDLIEPVLFPVKTKFAMYFKYIICSYMHCIYKASLFVYIISISILYTRNPKRNFLHAVQVKCV